MPAHIHNLPIYSTLFVGRTAELNQIHALLSNPACRLLTLVGTGGIGKTRLAVEAGRMVTGEPAAGVNDIQLIFPDGVWFTSLQPLVSPDLIVSAVAAVLNLTFYEGGSPVEQLLDYLRGKQLLLVLDNFEHLLDGTDMLLRIVETVHGVKLLVTSRERLRLREEWVLDVAGLPFPAANSAGPLNGYSAIQLFTHTALRAGFLPQEADTAVMAHICHLVEGNPLAIELAAAWTYTIPCVEIAREIARGLDILTSAVSNMPEKHRSMRAAFEHSWNMLRPDEQAVFRKLSIFRGGFLREAAEKTAGASLMTLAALVDKSLLRLNPNGRYDLHELLRQFSDEQLEAGQEKVSIQAAHAAYFAHFLHARVADIKGRRQADAIFEIAAEFENVRTAWHWAVDGCHPDTISQMVEGLWLYCTMRSREYEGRALFRYAEQRFASRPEPELRRLWGQFASRAADKQGASEARLESALQIAQLHDDHMEMAYCLDRLGLNAYAVKDYTRATHLLEQSVTHYRLSGDSFHILNSLFVYYTHNDEASWESKKALMEESILLANQIGDKIGIGWLLATMAIDNIRVGNFSEGERLWRQRIEIGNEVDNLDMVALGYAHLSFQVYFIQGQFEAAAAAAQETLKLPAQTRHVDATAWALMTLGLIASMREDYQEAKRLVDQASSMSYLTFLTDCSAWAAAIALCGLGDYESAEALLPAGLRYGVKKLDAVGVIMCLPVAAAILADRGEIERAVELLGLAFTHPIRAFGWIEKWPLVTRLRGALEAATGSEVYSSAWERGRLLDPLAVADELQSYFRATSDVPAGVVLTEREIEILRLLADGLNSREIAQTLYLTVGTVRWYRKEIYSKLHVNSRSQAIARARELKLLV